jgi:hypothetical protein
LLDILAVRFDIIGTFRQPMMERIMRVALIHALRHSPPPAEAAFARLWSEAELIQITDESLSSDLAKEGAITRQMTRRFLALAGYAVENEAAAILFTCSAFGPCIEACAAAHATMPVLKPNEAMIEEVSALKGKIGLVASFAPTLASMPAEFPPGIEIETRYVAGALEALDRGDGAEHDRLVAEAAATMSGCGCIALAQFSLARAAGRVAERTGLQVVTTPDSAVRKLRRLLKS